MARVDPIFDEQYIKDKLGFIPNLMINMMEYYLINKITYNNDDAQVHFIVFDSVNMHNEHVRNVKWDPINNTFSDYDTGEYVDYCVMLEITKPKLYDIDYAKSTITPDVLKSPIYVTCVIHTSDPANTLANGSVFWSTNDKDAMGAIKVNNVLYLSPNRDMYITIIPYIPEDNKYHISKAFKELIYRLGITSDQKLKLVNAVEDCCTKIRDGEDTDDPHKTV